jgi:hypothetical protein
MTRTTGTIMGLALALTIPTASAIPAPSCPEVDSARAMLSRAAATQNDRELQAPRNQPETQAPRNQDVQAPREQRQDAPAPRARQEQETQAPRDQGLQAPRDGNPPSASGKQDTVPPQMKRAATLVKEADTACQAGNTAEASQKAKAAMALMQQ